MTFGHVIGIGGFVILGLIGIVSIVSAGKILLPYIRQTWDETADRSEQATLTIDVDITRQ